MASVEAAQHWVYELLNWARAENIHPDDVVPALLIAAVKIAVHHKGERPDLIDTLNTVVRVTYGEEMQRRDLARRH